MAGGAWGSITPTPVMRGPGTASRAFPPGTSTSKTRSGTSTGPSANSASRMVQVVRASPLSRSRRQRTPSAWNGESAGVPWSA